ncbi:MAG: clan AA aspartic protease, partial [Paludibacteraceae bacterium]|nr:clan AA aspartic protease [Paludibacteraceae bacterium]
MKTKLLTLCFALMASLTMSAQEADTHIASLINDEDWFALAEDLPQYRDSMQADYLRLIAEAMLQARTNHTEEAVTALTKLLSEHQAELGTQTALNLALLRLQLIGKQGHYAEAADGIQRIINQLESSGVTETQALRTLQKHYAVLRNYAPLSVSRPEKDIAVPFRLIEPQVTKREEWMRGGKKAYKGNLMTIPVLVHGKEYPFIFDTGAGATFLFEKTAREMGLTILPDTVTINGSQKGLRAWIDSLQIGGITCRNLVAYVGLSDAIDTLMTGVDAILGMD